MLSNSKKKALRVKFKKIYKNSSNEFVGEMWIEIDEKYETLIYLMFGDSVIRSDYEN